MSAIVEQLARFRGSVLVPWLRKVRRLSLNDAAVREAADFLGIAPA